MGPGRLDMRQDIFDWLEGLARAGTRSTRYEDGYKRFGYDPQNTGELREFHNELALCSEFTHEKQRPTNRRVFPRLSSKLSA